MEPFEASKIWSIQCLKKKFIKKLATHLQWDWEQTPPPAPIILAFLLLVCVLLSLCLVGSMLAGGLFWEDSSRNHMTVMVPQPPFSPHLSWSFQLLTIGIKVVFFFNSMNFISIALFSSTYASAHHNSQGSSHYNNVNKTKWGITSSASAEISMRKKTKPLASPRHNIKRDMW